MTKRFHKCDETCKINHKKTVKKTPKPKVDKKFVETEFVETDFVEIDFVEIDSFAAAKMISLSATQKAGANF